MVLKFLKKLIPLPVKKKIGGFLRNKKLRRLEKRAYVLFHSAPNFDNQKVLIFAQGRTGSTLLESLLVSSGLFESYGEALSVANTPKGKRLKSCYQYLQGLSKLNPNKGALCHVKLYQITEQQKDDPGQLIQQLSESWKIIYLYRENPVEHALSSIIAESRNAYETRSESHKLERLTVDIPYFESLVKGRLTYAKQEQDTLSGIEHYSISYERCLKNPANHLTTILGICRFLGIPEFVPESDLKKVNNKRLPDLIANYDDFCECIINNKWTDYVDDDDLKAHKPPQ